MQKLTKEKYATYDSWTDYFSDGQVSLKKLFRRNLFDEHNKHDYLEYFDRKNKHKLKQLLNNYKTKSWNELFYKLLDNEKTKKIEEHLSKEVKKLGSNHMYPLPELLFNAFHLTHLINLSVVIIGQDPYFNSEEIGETYCPQAMGLSFSIPVDIAIPSSLQNIYKNLIKYKHIEEMPKNGNLESWALQGCLMLNSSLTVLDGSNNKNCHQHIWKWFTDEIIRYISNNTEKVVFVLWGNDALNKMPMIDLDKHEVVVSSHPSGFSVDKPLKNYPSFKDCDHFGKINDYLKKWKKPVIRWI